jgi:hypothetical protein
MQHNPPVVANQQQNPPVTLGEIAIQLQALNKNVNARLDSLETNVKARLDSLEAKIERGDKNLAHKIDTVGANLTTLARASEAINSILIQHIQGRISQEEGQ